MPQQVSAALSATLTVILGVAVFAGFWIGVSFLISVMSGWRRFVEAYPAPAQREPDSVRLPMTSLALRRGGNYNNCVILHVSQRGVRFSVLFLFPFHKPFFVPWEDVVTQENGLPIFKRLGISMASLTTKRVPDLPLRIPARQIDKIARQLGVAWRDEPQA